MTLNDRFRFRRELFLNSDEVMNSAIDALGEIGTFADAETFCRASLDGILKMQRLLTLCHW